MKVARDAKRRAGVAQHDAGVPCSPAQHSARGLCISSHKLSCGAILPWLTSSVVLMAACAIARRPGGSLGCQALTLLSELTLLTEQNLC